VGQRVVRRSFSLLARAPSLPRGRGDRQRCPLVVPWGLPAPGRARPPEHRQPRHAQVPGGSPGLPACVEPEPSRVFASWRRRRSWAHRCRKARRLRSAARASWHHIPASAAERSRAPCPRPCALTPSATHVSSPGCATRWARRGLPPLPGGTPASLTLHAPAVRPPAWHLRCLSRRKRASWTCARRLAARRPCALVRQELALSTARLVSPSGRARGCGHARRAAGHPRPGLQPEAQARQRGA